MAGQRTHYDRAEDRLKAIPADEHQDLQVTALAAVAEAMLAVADELAELRPILGGRPPAQGVEESFTGDEVDRTMQHPSFGKSPRT